MAFLGYSVKWFIFIVFFRIASSSSRIFSN